MDDERDRTKPSPRPGDAKPSDDAPSDRDMAPSTDTSQDPVEDVDADREPGPGKS